MAETTLTPIEIGLTAAIVGVEDGEPAILVAGDEHDKDVAPLHVRSVCARIEPRTFSRAQRGGEFQT